MNNKMKDKKVEKESGTLVITKVIHHKTPQSGTWLHCFEVNVDGRTNTHNIPNKEYEGTNAVVEMNLTMEHCSVGSRPTFKISLDDDQGDVCSPQAEDKTNNEFTISSEGSQNFSAGDNWNYTLYWKLS